MSVYYQDESVTLYHGDCLDVLRGLPSSSVNACVTSPPYFGLRDYGDDLQHGMEESPTKYVETMRAVFAEVRRVLADDGTLWLNIGDSYQSSGGSSGVGPNALVGSTRRQGVARTRPQSTLRVKNLLGIPWRVAFALQDDGWTLRNDIIWVKGNAMPEAVTDRVSNRHEHLFLFTKSRRYWFDKDAIAEPSANADRPQRKRAEEIAAEKGITQAHIDAMRAAGMTDAGKARQQGGTGKNAPEVLALAAEAKEALGGYYREFLTADTRNPGDVWTIPTQPFAEAHFAVMAPELARRAIVAGCKPGGVVLDPYSGSGTTGWQATKNGRRYVGIDTNADYLDLSLRTRLQQSTLDFGEVTA